MYESLVLNQKTNFSKLKRPDWRAGGMVLRLGALTALSGDRRFGLFPSTDLWATPYITSGSGIPNPLPLLQALNARGTHTCRQNIPKNLKGLTQVIQNVFFNHKINLTK